jgi:hypothetical protein
MDNIKDSVEILSYGTTEVPEFLLKFAGVHRTPDIMPVMFKLVHANRNKNSDEFTEREMLSALKTVENKALNWEHTDEVIGTITDAFFIKVRDGVVEAMVSSKEDQEKINDEVENLTKAKELVLDEEQNKELMLAIAKCKTSTANMGVEEMLSISSDEKSSILAIGVVWVNRNRDRAEEMKDRSASGNLAWSMETFFNGFECSECSQEFSISDAECEHLENRHTFGSDTGRILTGLNFCGAATVKNPADSEAKNVALGKKMSEEEDCMAYKSFETKEEFETCVNEMLEKSNLSEKVSELESVIASLTEKLEATKAENLELSQLRDEVLASVETLKEELGTKETLVAELNEKITKFQDEEKRRLGEARLASLVEAGLKIPEDSLESMIEKLSNESVEAFEEFRKMIEASCVVAKEEVEVEAQASATVPSDMTETANAEQVEAPVAEAKEDEEDALDIVLKKTSRMAKTKDWR